MRAAMSDECTLTASDKVYVAGERTNDAMELAMSTTDRLDRI